MAASRSILVGLVMLLTVGLLALVASACDGGDTPAADETPAAGGTPEAEDGNGEAALQELGERAGSGDEVTARVAYEVTTGMDGAAFEGEWVLIQRPPDFRFEFIGTAMEEEVRTIIIDAGGEFYVCTSAAGQESCLEIDVSEAETRSAPFSPLFDIPQKVVEQSESIDSVRKSERTIAGVNATCFTIESALIDLPEGEICFSDEGILLLLRSLGATFEAISVSTDVADEDFEPPFEVLEAP